MAPKIGKRSRKPQVPERRERVRVSCSIVTTALPEETNRVEQVM